MRGPADTVLIAQVLVLHSQRAFGQLVERYQSAIRRFFLNQTCGDKPLSDDLAQETFIKAYTGLKGFQGPANFQTWLYRIAYNVFYDYIRSRKDEDGLEAVEADSDYSVEQADTGSKMDIYRALQQLGKDERTCVTLFYMEDKSIKQITSITGMAEGTVKSHLSRGKDKMAKYLKENGYGQ